jgi:signal transduction histidine kinase
MILIIAYIDYLTPAELSIRVLYLLPLFLSIWEEKGIIAGSCFSFICTLVYFYAEWLQGNIHWHGIYLIWEFIIVWGFFIVFVVIVSKLHKLNLLLLKNNEELKETNKQKDKFFAIIAHDLRSPFQGFLSITKTMAEEAENYSAQEFAELGVHMHQTAVNLFNLLKNLLDWAQMQKGSMSFQPNEFLLSDLIAENIEALKKTSDQKRITIINTVSDPVRAYGDEKMINSVLLNLISNAVKFTHRDGKVIISAKNIGDQMIKVSVSDTGIGMGKSLVEKLFKVGGKIRSLGTEGELSTGLGLLLCKEFVEKNGGKISIESQEGKGSTLNFTLQKSKNIAD